VISKLPTAPAVGLRNVITRRARPQESCCLSLVQDLPRYQAIPSKQLLLAKRIVSIDGNSALTLHTQCGRFIKLIAKIANEGTMHKSQPTPMPAFHQQAGRRDLLLHIADMAEELKKLARNADANLLAALLGMVLQEAVLQASLPQAPSRQSLSKPTLTS
jgi:hypothetical protein